MMRVLITILFLFSFTYSRAQISAITESGEQVILNQDGTWAYADISNDSTAIKVNDQTFSKSNTSTFLIKSKKTNFGIWINPKKWQFEKSSENEASEYTFKKKDDDLYGMLIAEKIEIPVENLKGIALTNARNAAPDTKIIQEEYRFVNDLKILMIQMTGTIQGIKFIYYGYYYSNANGTIQFLTYTSQNLFENYKKEMEDMLNGIVTMK